MVSCHCHLMGKSETVVMVTDDQIRDFVKKPSRLQDFVREAIALIRDPRCCHLFDWWAIIHYAITDGVPNAPLPLGAIRRGDVQYSKEPAHALYTATVKALAEKLKEITDSSVKKTLDARDMKTMVYPGRYWVSPQLAAGGEFLGELHGFREFANRAASQN